MQRNQKVVGIRILRPLAPGMGPFGTTEIGTEGPADAFLLRKPNDPVRAPEPDKKARERLYWKCGDEC